MRTCGTNERPCIFNSTPPFAREYGECNDGDCFAFDDVNYDEFPYFENETISVTYGPGEWRQWSLKDENGDPYASPPARVFQMYTPTSQSTTPDVKLPLLIYFMFQDAGGSPSPAWVGGSSGLPGGIVTHRQLGQLTDPTRIRIQKILLGALQQGYAVITLSQFANRTGGGIDTYFAFDCVSDVVGTTPCWDNLNCNASFRGCNPDVSYLMRVMTNLATRDHLDFERAVLFGYSVGGYFASRLMNNAPSMTFMPRVVGAILVGSGSYMTTFSPSDQPINMSEAAYDLSVYPWQSHPPVLMLASNPIWPSLSGADDVGTAYGVAYYYYEKLLQNNVPMQLITNQGSMHGMCDCQFNYTLQFLFNVKTRSNNVALGMPRDSVEPFPEAVFSAYECTYTPHECWSLAFSSTQLSPPPSCPDKLNIGDINCGALTECCSGLACLRSDSAFTGFPRTVEYYTSMCTTASECYDDSLGKWNADFNTVGFSLGSASLGTLAGMREGLCDPFDAYNGWGSAGVWTRENPYHSYSDLDFLAQCSATWKPNAEHAARYSNAEYTVIGLLLNLFSNNDKAIHYDPGVPDMYFLGTFIIGSASVRWWNYAPLDPSYKEYYVSHRLLQEIGGMHAPATLLRLSLNTLPQGDFDVSMGGFCCNGYATLDAATLALYNTLSLNAPSPLVKEEAAYLQWLNMSRFDLNSNLIRNTLIEADGSWTSGESYVNGMRARHDASTGHQYYYEHIDTYSTMGMWVYLTIPGSREDILLVVAMNVPAATSERNMLYRILINFLENSIDLHQRPPP